MKKLSGNFKLIELTRGIGHQFAYAAALNNHDDALFVIGVARDKPAQTFIWKRGRLVEVTHKYRTRDNRHGLSMNDACQVVGSIGADRDSQNAFFWENGEMVMLLANGAQASYAQGINNSGLIVGSALPSSGAYGVLWKGDKIIDTGKSVSKDWTFFTSINDKEDIVGFERMKDDYRPFLYSGRKVEHLPKNPLGKATYINNKQYIAGSLDSNNSNNETAFLYADKQLRTLGTLGGKVSRARCVNESMVVVGESYMGNTTNYHAFLWKDGKLFDLNNLVDTVGVELTNAVAINKHGHILCEGIAGGRINIYLLTE